MENGEGLRVEKKEEKKENNQKKWDTQAAKEQEASRLRSNQEIGTVKSAIPTTSPNETPASLVGNCVGMKEEEDLEQEIKRRGRSAFFSMKADARMEITALSDMKAKKKWEERRGEVKRVKETLERRPGLQSTN